ARNETTATGTHPAARLRGQAGGRAKKAQTLSALSGRPIGRPEVRTGHGLVICQTVSDKSPSPGRTHASGEGSAGKTRGRTWWSGRRTAVRALPSRSRPSAGPLAR